MKTLARAAVLAGAAVFGFAVVRIALGADSSQRGAPPPPAGTRVSSREAHPLLPASNSEDPARSDDSGADAHSSVPSRILSAFLADLTEDDIERILEVAAIGNAAIQHIVLDLYFENDLPAMFDLVRKVLPWNPDLEVIKRLLGLFSNESNLGRRHSTAWILGGNAHVPEVLAAIVAVLDGPDVLSKEHILQRLEVDDVPRDSRERMALMLREIVRSGERSTLRAAAAGALGGDETEEGIRFLVDRILQDPDDRVRQRAIGSLPRFFSDEDVKLEEEAMGGLYSIAIDPATQRDLQRSAARKLNWLFRSYKGALYTQEQKAAIESLAGKEPSIFGR